MPGLLEYPVATMADNKTDRRDRVDLRVEPEWYQRVEAQASRFGQSMSAYIRQAVIEKLERDEATIPRPPKKS